MKFRDVFDRVAWGAVTMLAFAAVAQMKDLTKNVADLNTNVAVLVRNSADQDKRMERMENWQSSAEKRVNALEIFVERFGYGEKRASRAQRRLLSE